MLKSDANDGKLLLAYVARFQINSTPSKLVQIHADKKGSSVKLFSNFNSKITTVSHIFRK